MWFTLKLAVKCCLMITMMHMLAASEISQSQLAAAGDADADQQLQANGVGDSVSPRQRALLGARKPTLLLFVHDLDRQIPVEVDANGKLNDIFTELSTSNSEYVAANYDLTFQGKVMQPDGELADTGVGMEALLELRRKPTDCMRLTKAFEATNVWSKLNWIKADDDFADHRCCDDAFNGIKCDLHKIKSIELKYVAVDVTTIDWAQLEETSVQKISITAVSDGDPEMHGEVDWCHLPRSLKRLMFHRTPLGGSVGWDCLPPALEYLQLAYSAFDGEVNLQRLPATLRVLRLDSNRFSGSLDLSRLHETSLKELSVASNQLSGTVDLTQLPETMEFLDLSNNAFVGTPVLDQLTEGLEVLDLSYNQFDCSDEEKQQQMQQHERRGVRIWW